MDGLLLGEYLEHGLLAIVLLFILKIHLLSFLYLTHCPHPLAHAFGVGISELRGWP